MSLQIEFKSKRSKDYELSVIIKLGEFENTNISLYSFPDRFRESLKEIPRVSVGYAADFYMAELTGNNKEVKVWHLNIKGDPDRLLAIVKDDGKEFNPFNF